MDTELKVLKKIFQENEKVSVGPIADHLGYSLAYINFLCKKLEEKGLVKNLWRDFYKITAKGKTELAKRNLIKRASRKKSFKIESPFWETVRMKSIPRIRLSRKIKFKPIFGKPKEEKLKIGEKIEKAASFLGKLNPVRNL